MLLIFLLISYQYYCAWAQMISFGSCPGHIQAIKDFDIEKYTGRWYEVERYYFFMEMFGRCTYVDYFTKEGSPNELRSNTRITRPITNYVISVDARAPMVDPDGSGILSVVFPIISWAGGFPYRILDTDYENYSIIWSCYDLGLINLQNVWILSRKKFPDHEIIKKARSFLESKNIPLTFMTRTSQDNCQDDRIDIKI